MSTGLIDYAIQRFDVLSYALDKGGDQIKKNEVLMECPICMKEKLTVNIEKKAWHCWVCQRYENINGKLRPVEGAGGLIDLIQLLDNVNRKAAIDIVLSAAFMRPDDLLSLSKADFLAGLAEQDVSPRPIQPPEGLRIIDQMLPYMVRRGISPTDVSTLGLAWCDSGRYANRLIFPVFENKELVYFQARAMWDPVPGERFRKALNPAATEGAAVSTQVLMNLDLAKQCSRVAITEGPMDCVRSGVDAVCTFGKQITGTQIHKLLRAGVTAIDLMWDADARNEMIAMSKILSMLFDVRLVFLPYGDPADFTRYELDGFRRCAQSIDDSRLMYV